MILFRRLVEHALDGGDENGIKERTLGIEVFGREADYDTNTDPIVRMTANEIRKRLAQYYQSSSRHHEVHISLVPGDYVPRFSFGLQIVSPAASDEIPSESAITPAHTPEQFAATPAESAAQVALLPRTRSRTRWMLPLAVTAIGLAVLALIALNATNLFRSNQYLLWAPLLKSPEPVIICVGDRTLEEMTGVLAKDWASQLADQIAGRRGPFGGADAVGMPLTSYVDAEVAARVGGWFKEHGRPFRMARTSRLSLDDFRHGPVVLVGAFDNYWNLALFSKLRFHVQIDPATKDEWIEDSQNPSNREWKGSGNLIYSDSSVDYAIVTRVFNKDTETWFVSAGGLGLHATEAAGDLLTDTTLSGSLPEAVRSGNKNVQIVLKTTVIGGHTGAPQILAVHTW